MDMYDVYLVYTWYIPGMNLIYTMLVSYCHCMGKYQNAPLFPSLSKSVPDPDIANTKTRMMDA